jgi:hypothetical protein
MTTLAKAVIEMAAFLELSGEDVVSIDGSVTALETLATTLRSASPEEITAIYKSLKDFESAERAGLQRKDVLNFYAHFLEGLGLAGEEKGHR